MIRDEQTPLKDELGQYRNLIHNVKPKTKRCKCALLVSFFAFGYLMMSKH